MSWKRCALTGWALSLVAALGTYMMSASLLLAVIEFALAAAVMPIALRLMSGESL